MEEIMESNYYDILGVRSTASREEIEQAFYLKGGQVCPSRNPNVPNAGEKYQALTVAYEVMIDPVQRAAYDRSEGYNQIREKLVDPAEAYKDYIGQLIIRSDAISAQLEGNPLDFNDKLKTVQKEREDELAGKLRDFLDQYVHGDKDTFTQRARSEAKRLSGSAYQVELLHMIGQTYSSQAAQELGKRAIWLGVPFLTAWVRNKLQYRKSQNIIAQDVFPIVQAQEEIRLLKERYGPGKDHAEAESSNAMKESESLIKDERTLAKKIWKLTAADIQVTLVNVCQMVLYGSDVTKEELNDRAMGLKILGKIFEEQQAGNNGGITSIQETERGEIVVETDDVIGGLIESDYSSSSEVVFPCITQAIMRVMDCLCIPSSRSRAAANFDSGDDRTEELMESDTS